MSDPASTGPPRLQPRTPDDDPRLAELFARGLTGPDGAVLNIFGTIGHHPDLLRRWLVFAAHVLSKSTLTPRASGRWHRRVRRAPRRQSRRAR